MNKLKNKILELKENNKLLKFILNSKNIAIIILSLLLFCFIITYSDSDYYKNYLQIKQFEEQITELNLKLEENKNQIINLQNANKLLQEENIKLEENNKQLESEKEKLEQEIEELKISIYNKSTKNSFTNISTNPSNSSNSATSSNSYTVYITNTGKKYHSANCNYLNKSKISIDKNSAISQGYTPCNKCNP